MHDSLHLQKNWSNRTGGVLAYVLCIQRAFNAHSIR